MEFEIFTRGQISSPRIIDDHGRAELRSLHNCLNFSPIFHPKSSPFRKEEIDSALFIAITALEKAIGVEDELQAVLCRAEFEEFTANSFRNEH